MKKINGLVTCMLLIVVLVVLTHCGGSTPDPTPAEADAQKNTKLLTAGVWSAQNVLVDGVDKTSIYKDLKITFSATGFTATSGGSVWPASGTWKFSDDSGKVINRGDLVTINLNEITSTKLVLALTWTKTTLGSGRVQSMSGAHVFTFGK